MSGLDGGFGRFCQTLDGVNYTRQSPEALIKAFWHWRAHWRWQSQAEPSLSVALAEGPDPQTQGPVRPPAKTGFWADWQTVRTAC